MKEKVKIFILGLLIGAVVTAGIFLIFKNNKSNQMPNMNREKTEFNGERPTDMQGRKNRNNSNIEVDDSKTIEESSTEEASTNQ